MVTSWLPRPARVPLTVAVRPLSVRTGLPPLKWTLAAMATEAVRPRTIASVQNAINMRRMTILPIDWAASPSAWDQSQTRGGHTDASAGLYWARCASALAGSKHGREAGG